MMTENDILPILLSSAALGGLIIFILAAWIPAGKAPKKPESFEPASGKEIAKAKRRMRGI